MEVFRVCFLQSQGQMTGNWDHVFLAPKVFQRLAERLRDPPASRANIAFQIRCRYVADSVLTLAIPILTLLVNSAWGGAPFNCGLQTHQNAKLLQSLHMWRHA